MIKNSILTLLACMVCLGASAQAVDFATAKKIAENYRNQWQNGQSASISESLTQMRDGKAVFHIFNFAEGGFVIVSAEEKTKPILAYSTENSFDIQMENPVVRQWMNAYSESVASAAQSEEKSPADVLRQWEELKAGTPVFRQKKGENAVAPLLPSTWNQNKYYNTNCPADDNSEGEAVAGTASYDNHVPVGCVALSASQIMYYYRHPKKGSGSTSYTSSYGKLSANFGQTNYNFNAMADVATDYSNAIAQLINHAGIAVNMGYGPAGSGSQTIKIVNALKKYFGYASTIQFAERKNYTDSAWHKLLKDNLDQGCPMVYSGNPSEGGEGHAWNCDGYDANGNFHMNWGWGGSSNGYYNIDNLNKVGKYDFSGGHEVVCNIKPQNFTVKTNDTLTATYGSFALGNRAMPYTDANACTWLICPPNATTITLTCSNFDTDTNDVLSIYGDAAKTTLLATYSGKHIAGKSLRINGGTAYITFTPSNDNNTGSGFLFNYTTTLNSLDYCNITEIISNTYRITETSGTINNGSNGKAYADANTCYWRLEPQGANAIWLAFDQFDLGEGDELTVFNYKAANNFNSSILQTISSIAATYTKANPPALDKTIAFDKNGIYLRFRSDNDKAGKGWSLRYGINVGVEEHQAGMTACNVYPNPATDRVNVQLSFETNESRSISLRLTDMMGRSLYQTSLNTQENQTEIQLPVENYAAGVYFLTIQTGKGSISRKIQLVR
ncbi:MAG: C10 family peptidase [Bacteroidales bacterium]|nr:C10 family peptidase [Bacteroidales bacterium]